MRHILVLVHRYVGLAIAALLICTSLTGSVIVFRGELDALLNPVLFRVVACSTPMLGFDGIARAVSRFDPDILPGTIVFTRRPDESAQVVIVPRPGAVPPGYNQLFVDPYNGAVLGQRSYGAFGLDRVHLIPFLHRLHYTLMLPAALGTFLLGIVGLLWLFDCFVGFVLTFPRGGTFWQKWRPAWEIKRGASAYRINLDLHRASGLWLWPFLFLLAFTSVALSLKRELFQPVVAALLPTSDDQARPQGRVAAGRNGVGFAIARAIAEARRRGWAGDVSVAYLLHARHVFGVRFGSVRESGWGASVVFVDQGSGRVLRADEAGMGKSGDLLNQLMLPIHSGRVAGMTGRVLICLTGIGIALLSAVCDRHRVPGLESLFWASAL